MEQITELMSEMTFAEKCSLNERLAIAIRKESGGKTGKTKKKSDGEDKPKRKAAPGTLAWTAYVKHLKTESPEKFEGLAKESEKLVVCKGIRAEDPDGYKTFTEDWIATYKADHAEAESAASASAPASAAASDDEEAEAAPAPAPAPVKKVVKAVAAEKEKKVEKVEEVEKAPKADKAQKEKAPKVEKAEKEKKEKAPKVEKVEKADKKEKKEKKSVKAKSAPVEETIPTIEIADKTYWHDKKTNALWEKVSDNMAEGVWTGYYQPEDEDSPIRYTEEEEI